jgi:hypothetical protein
MTSKQEELRELNPCKLPHTERIEQLLAMAQERREYGDAREAGELEDKAKRLHNAHVSAELERAKSEPINLSDLMAARESFEVQR